nr:hypothetical protein [Tanacetum cinerariifolium]
MSTQQDIYAVGSESRPPMLNKENYVPWSSRLLWYAKSRPNGKLIHNSILNGPYVRRMIPEPGDAERDVNVNETFHEQTDDELFERELKQIEADDQAIQTILLEPLRLDVLALKANDVSLFGENFLKWVKAEMVSPEVESEKWRRLLYIRCVLPLMYQLMAMKKTSFPEMKCNGSIVSEKIGDSSRMVTSVSILEEPIKVENALSQTVVSQGRYFHTFAINQISRVPIRTMSSPNHPTSNIEDIFSLNFLNFIPASSDYVPASPGKTYSSSSNLFDVVLIASPSLLLFHDDPYMKVMHAYYAEKSPIPPPIITPPSLMPNP